MKRSFGFLSVFAGTVVDAAISVITFCMISVARPGVVFGLSLPKAEPIYITKPSEATKAAISVIEKVDGKVFKGRWGGGRRDCFFKVSIAVEEGDEYTPTFTGIRAVLTDNHNHLDSHETYPQEKTIVRFASPDWCCGSLRPSVHFNWGWFGTDSMAFFNAGETPRMTRILAEFESQDGQAEKFRRVRAWDYPGSSYIPIIDYAPRKLAMDCRID